MSSARKNGGRRLDDNYPTPAWAVHRFIETGAIPGGVWLDPCAGEGSIIRAVQTPLVKWCAVELRDSCREPLGKLEAAKALDSFAIGDFLLGTLPTASPRPTAILTNPPFSDAIEFIEQALALGLDHVAMLLRLNFLSSDDRQPFFKVRQPDVYVLPNRPDFTGEGGDSTDYAWMVWPKEPRDRGSVTILNTTPLEVRRPPRPRKPRTPKGPTP